MDQKRGERLFGIILCCLCCTTALPGRAEVGVGLPVISKQPQPSSVMIEGSSTFTVEVSSAGPVSYQWFCNGNALAGGTNATYTVGPVLSGDEGVYSVLVANYAGAVMSQAAALRIPNPATDPKGSVLLASGNFSSPYVSGGSVYVQLYAGPSMDQLTPISDPIKASTSTTYVGRTISSELLSIGRNYYFQLRGWNGSTANPSDAWVIGYSEIISAVPVGNTMIPPKSPPTLKFSNIELYLWDKYQFYAGVSTNGSTRLGGTFQFVASGRTMTGFSDPPFIQTDTGWPMYYQWRKDGVDILGATNSTFAVTNFQAANAGTYSCLFYNGRTVYSTGYSLAADFTPRLTPMGSLNSSGVWMFANPGTPVTIQVSTNLGLWTDYATVIPATNRLEFTFPAEFLSRSNLFYRAVLKP